MRSTVRNLLLGLGLALMAAGGGQIGGAQAGTLPGSGPNPNWTDMQKTEWYIGYMSKAAAICRFYDKASALSALASLSPYGRIGLRSFSGDGFYGAACQGIGEDADALLGDKSAFTEYFAAIYDCEAGGDCTTDDLSDRFATDHLCAQKLYDVLGELSLKRDDIKNITFSSPPPGPSNAGAAPYQARVRMKSCQGSLYVDLGAQCTVKQSYTRGDCEVAGVSGF